MKPKWPTSILEGAGQTRSRLSIHQEKCTPFYSLLVKKPSLNLFFFAHGMTIYICHIWAKKGSYFSSKAWFPLGAWVRSTSMGSFPEQHLENISLFLFLSGQIKLGPHPDWSTLGFNLRFLKSTSDHFIFWCFFFLLVILITL